MKGFFISLAFLALPLGASDIDFNTQIRPLLSEYCFHCHGPDKETREGKLRLDLETGEDGAYRVRKERHAIFPGDAQKSHIYLRMVTEDEDDIMPPPESKKKMKPKEIAIIKKWLEQGAKYETHWAFNKPKKSSAQQAPTEAWNKNELDRFIFSKLKSKNMAPSSEADARTLVRRLFLDLTGLPPTPTDINSYLQSKNPSKYEQLVDRLLKSPAHAERMALEWLDLARYADTNGFSIDDHRDMWAWRDWVINAFMENMPYDQFITEQLAGDLMVEKIANKQGKQAPKVDNKALKSANWIWRKGKIKTEKVNFKKTITLKKKPAKALLKATCDDNFKLKINGKLAAVSDHWQKPVSVDVSKFLKAGKNELLIEAGNEGKMGGLVMLLQIGKHSIISDESWLAQGIDGQWNAAVELKKYGAGPWGNVLNTPVKTVSQPAYSQEDLQRIVATGFLRNSMNTHEGGTIAEEYRVNYAIDKLDTVSTTFLGLTVKCAQCHDHKFDPISQKNFFQMYAYFNQSQEPGKGATNGNTKPFIHLNTKLTPKDKMIIAHQARITELQNAKKKFTTQKTNLGFPIKTTLKAIDQEIKVIQKQIKAGKTSVMVMNDKQPRKTFILDRGQYNKPTTEVSAGVLNELLPFPKGAPNNRLGLAQWMTHPDHPLTARVAVNRLWQIIFNRGLVETSEDFGSQGSVPTHQKLLDNLALKFQQDNWDIRKMLKYIVTSATYKQSSVIREEYRTIDPRNIYMSYAPNFRLKAEFIRDNALAVAGLLNRDIGGPSVYPPQPKGLWAQVSHFGYQGSFTTQVYFPSTGNNALRRSLYSVIKRTAAHPAMANFDSPNRETCTSKRQTTNTPTQALVSLNAPQFVEASKALAIKITAASKDLKTQLIRGFEFTLNRRPSLAELQLMQSAYKEQLDFYSKNKKLYQDKTKAQQAAMNAVCSLLLNLSETITRR